jgi:spore germination protein
LFKKLFSKLNKDSKREGDEFDLELSSHLEQTVSSINDIVGESNDVIQRDLTIFNKFPASIFYIKGLCNDQTLEEDVIKPLIRSEQDLPPFSSKNIVDQLTKEVLTIASFSVFDTFEKAIQPFMSGDALLVIDGVEQIIVLGTRGFDQRGIEEPQSEIVVRGPRDGFVESLQTNITLIRRRITDPNFTVQIGELGRRGKRRFSITYIKGIANADLVEEIRYRVSCVDIDDVPETGILEQLIEDNALSPFPQFLHTERPDKAVWALMNGQVVILLDGTPFVLLAPITLQQLMKSTEDYYERWQIGSLIRLLRYLAAFIAIFLPSLYIAMVAFHHGMIPTTLALSISSTREGVPFPAFIEALLMEMTLELLREAGIRLPRPIGQTIGIVGGLVIGEAAVQAGFVSPIMVIVVALTAIASFALPSYSVSITFRMLRFGVMLAAATFGLYGIIMVYILINIHLVGLRSFGSYYTSPFAPYRPLDWLDLVLRAPLTLQRIRTDEPRTLDNKKQN